MRNPIETFVHHAVAGVCFLLVTLIAAPSPALASSAGEAVIVRTRDLDLTTDAGARRLLRRLDHAIDLVCGGSFLQQFSAARRAHATCYESKMSETLARLDAPLVHEQYTRQSARTRQRTRNRQS
ncbi:MAG: UrcA family protein [Phycisphaerales bacterium]|nr:UrcA family protein [Hyphomonadaceae bacterium]